MLLRVVGGEERTGMQALLRACIALLHIRARTHINTHTCFFRVTSSAISSFLSFSMAASGVSELSVPDGIQQEYRGRDKKGYVRSGGRQ